LKLAKSFVYNTGADIESNMRRLEQDLSQLFLFSQGRVRFGTGTDGDRGENISGEFQVVTSSTADTEFTVAHGLGATPIGFLVLRTDKGGVVYDSGTAWNDTNIYLKCTTATTTLTLFLLK
jgi:hypothetical protein